MKIINSKGVLNPDKLLNDPDSEFQRDYRYKGIPYIELEINSFVEKIIYIDGNGIADCTVSYFDGEWKEITNLHLSSWQTRKELEVNREISRIKFSGNLLPKYIEFHGKPIEKPEPTPINETQKIIISGAKGSFEDGEKFVLTFDKKPKEFTIIEADKPEPSPAPTPEEPQLETGKILIYKKPIQKINPDGSESSIMTGYALRLPEDYYASGKEYPLIISYHGDGERGAVMGIENLPNKYPAKALPKDCILICPQNLYTWGKDITPYADAMIEEAIKGLRVDSKRIYVTGLSKGGFAAWEHAIQFPEKVAACVPVCGWVQSGNEICNAVNVPIWAFHNEGDKTVGVGGTLQAVNNLLKCGSTVVKKTIYPVSGHDAWTKTYNDSAMWEWLLSQVKSLDIG